MVVQVSNAVELSLRPVQSDDVEACGRICFEAFTAISSKHGFPRDFPNVEVATGFIAFVTQHAGFYGVVAERDGRIVGSNFLDERSTIAGVGPITVDPNAQDRGTGKRLMQAVLERADERRFPGVRLALLWRHAVQGPKRRDGLPKTRRNGPSLRFRLAQNAVNTPR
jgi:predicted N-acetyltransferase YhbS